MPNYRLTHGSVQDGFQQSRGKIQVFGGGFGNGKTTALVVKSLKLVRDYPGSNGLLARETYPKLNDTLRKEFFKWCPSGWIKKMPTQDDNTCTMHNGTIVNFRYIQQRGRQSVDGGTTSNLLSATYDWIGIDQIEDPGIVFKDFLDLLGRLRGDTTYSPDDEGDTTMPGSGPRWFMCTSNPTANWFFREIVQPYILWRDRGIVTDKLLVDADSKLPILELFESDTYANRANLGDDYIKTLEAAYKGQMRERYLKGKWAAFEGLVHPDFSIEQNCMSREEMVNHLIDCLKRHVKVKVLEGYDFGIAKPSCYMMAFVDDYGRVFVLDGFYEAEFLYEKQVEKIKELRMRYMGALNFKDRINADPAIFRRQVIASKKNTGDTLAKLFKDLGIHMRPATNDILPGIAKINSYINGTMNTPHCVTHTKPGPLLYINSELEWFMDEISSYYWKRNPLGKCIDEPVDDNDHAMNTLKYLLAFLPEASKIVVPQSALPPKWKYWQEMSDEDEALERQATA